LEKFLTLFPFPEAFAPLHVACEAEKFSKVGSTVIESDLLESKLTFEKFRSALFAEAVAPLRVACDVCAVLITDIRSLSVPDVAQVCVGVCACFCFCVCFCVCVCVGVSLCFVCAWCCSQTLDLCLPRMLHRCVLVESVSVSVSVCVFVYLSLPVSVSLYVWFVCCAAHRHWTSVCPGCCTGVCCLSVCVCVSVLYVCSCVCVSVCACLSHSLHVVATWGEKKIQAKNPIFEISISMHARNSCAISFSFSLVRAGLSSHACVRFPIGGKDTTRAIIHTHTHTHAQTQTHEHKHTYTHTHTLFFSLSLSHTHTRTPTGSKEATHALVLPAAQRRVTRGS